MHDKLTSFQFVAIAPIEVGIADVSSPPLRIRWALASHSENDKNSVPHLKKCSPLLELRMKKVSMRVKGVKDRALFPATSMQTVENVKLQMFIMEVVVTMFVVPSLFAASISQDVLMHHTLAAAL